MTSSSRKWHNIEERISNITFCFILSYKSRQFIKLWKLSYVPELDEHIKKMSCSFIETFLRGSQSSKGIVKQEWPIFIVMLLCNAVWIGTHPEHRCCPLPSRYWQSCPWSRWRWEGPWGKTHRPSHTCSTGRDRSTAFNDLHWELRPQKSWLTPHLSCWLRV